MVIFLQLALTPLLITGWKGVPEGIVTSTDDVGITPSSQLDALFHAVLTVPFHRPGVAVILRFVKVKLNRRWLF